MFGSAFLESAFQLTLKKAPSFQESPYYMSLPQHSSSAFMTSEVFFRLEPMKCFFKSTSIAFSSPKALFPTRTKTQQMTDRSVFNYSKESTL